jgi:hypothetical protein
LIAGEQRHVQHGRDHSIAWVLLFRSLKSAGRFRVLVGAKCGKADVAHQVRSRGIPTLGLLKVGERLGVLFLRACEVPRSL